jgi:hypothetical protein
MKYLRDIASEERSIEDNFCAGHTIIVKMMMIIRRLIYKRGFFLFIIMAI